ncbi:MAG TPA: ACP S-malonyltransferase [Blastocatellia bacterium]
MRTAFIFPGQGSQRVGMGKELVEVYPAAAEVFQLADDVLGHKLSSLCFEGPEEELRLTANTQPAILTTSIAMLRVLEPVLGKADFVAGHSLGEYSALVAAESLKFEDALKLVRARGGFMQDAMPPGEGAMAAIMGCETQTIIDACKEASERGVCSPANINSPGQVVIAGHRPAVEYAVELLKARGARRTTMLAVSAPFHCELMRPAADRLGPMLERTQFSDLTTPLVTNVDARVVSSGQGARESLVRQVTLPVRWSETMSLLINEGVTKFVELGPGKVLSGLAKQICRESAASCEIITADSAESVQSIVSARV